jgi:rare lipoprotein A
MALGLLAACTPVRRLPAPVSPKTPIPSHENVDATPSPPCCAAPASRSTRPSDAELLALPDAVPRDEPRAALGNPAFYEVYGQRYKVLQSAGGFVERGVASWYGPDFHGIATSTGEPYDMYSMTAAHKTLPLPAYVRVTNLRNGRSIVVRVNDRGPFKANRIIDLSYAAALKLDMVREGTTLVEIESRSPLGTEFNATPPSPAALYAQVGAFGLLDNAQRLQSKLTAAGLGSVQIATDSHGSRPLHRVRIGPVDSVEAYDGLVIRLHGLGIEKVVLAPN